MTWIFYLLANFFFYVSHAWAFLLCTFFVVDSVSLSLIRILLFLFVMPMYSSRDYNQNVFFYHLKTFVRANIIKHTKCNHMEWTILKFIWIFMAMFVWRLMKITLSLLRWKKFIMFIIIAVYNTVLQLVFFWPFLKFEMRFQLYGVLNLTPQWFRFR